MIFKNMKGIAESYLGTAVTGAVISVPASYNDSQRRATRQAGKRVILQYWIIPLKLPLQLSTKVVILNRERGSKMLGSRLGLMI